MDAVHSKANWNFADQLPNLHLDLALHRFVTFSPDFENKERVSRRALVQSGFFCNNEQKPQCFYCDFVIHDLSNWKSRIDHQHLQNSINCPLMTDKVHDFPLTNIHNFVYEAWRLYSFFNTNWPNKNISPFDLAHEGFYFTGEGDACICHFCNLKVNSWEVGDKARSEHFRWNPLCPFLKNVARNVDIGKEFAAPIRNSNQVTDGMQLERLKKIGAINAKRNKAAKGAPIRINEKNLGIFSISASRHPEMKEFESRQRSFLAQDWPTQKQNLIPILCKAGFYYTGESDLCKCFHCGLGINDWEASDCPWTEHGRFNADCTYLSLFSENLDHESYYSKCVDEKKHNARFDNRNCRDCNEKEANTACLPCGHVLFCETCVDKHPSCARNFRES